MHIVNEYRNCASKLVNEISLNQNMLRVDTLQL